MNSSESDGAIPGIQTALELAGHDPGATGGAQSRGGGEWAICCSGGGIRSAAYCLGALQSLAETGLLPKVSWIFGVSGGSYIAASRALVAHHLPPKEKSSAYGPGTPEERNLRHNTHYIAPNGATVLVGILSLVFGAIITFILATAPLYALAHAWGWVLRWQGVLVPSGPHTLTAVATRPGWWLPSVIAAGITFELFIFWWLTLRPGLYRYTGRAAASWELLKSGDRDPAASRARLVNLAAFLTVALALAMLAVPPLISWLTRSTGSFGTIARFVGFGARPSLSLTALAGLIAAVAAVARFAQAGLAKWNAQTGQGTAGAQPGLLTRAAGWLRQKLLPWLGSVVVVLIGIVLALLWTSDGARAGFTAGQLLRAGLALVLMLITRVAVNVNRMSMHDFYRWRLADAFAVTRQAAETRNLSEARRLFGEAAATRLSGLRDGPGDPDLVICATANINAARQVPPGQGGFCVSFDAEHVTLRGGKDDDPAGDARARTSDYEDLEGYGRFTLFDVAAISGAAISPLMGAATRQAYRILLTATNVRLGVWLPHPDLVRKASEWIEQNALAEGTSGKRWERYPLLLLLWYQFPHPFWDRNTKRNFDREARLWAHVLTLRRKGRLTGAFWYRAMQPTLGLLWAEAVGRLSYRETWMYVTDGGHYDNLGLVEALRRGASNIVVLDAAGDKPDTWFTLGGAIGLARTDAGVAIELDPTTMVRGGRDLAPGQVVRPWAHGRFRRLQDYQAPRKTSPLPPQGEIWMCKLGWWTGAPWDVLAYARDHPTYPSDSTLVQLYDATEFEAYQQLGVAAASDAATHCAPPLRWASQPVPEADPGKRSVIK